MGVVRGKKGCPAQITCAVPASNACGSAPPVAAGPLSGSHHGHYSELVNFRRCKLCECQPFLFIVAGPRSVARGVSCSSTTELRCHYRTTVFDLRHRHGQTNPSLNGEHKDKNPSSYSPTRRGAPAPFEVPPEHHNNFPALQPALRTGNSSSR